LEAIALKIVAETTASAAATAAAV